MSIKVITVTTNKEATQPLINSLVRNGWDYECIYTPEWKGFGSKLIFTYNYLKEHPEVKEFIFCDAFDVVALGNPDEFRKKMTGFGDIGALISSEKGLWPPYLHPFERLYCHHPLDSKFIYPNSGLYYAKSRLFKHWMEFYPPTQETDDQFWFNMVYLKNNTNLLDEVHLNFAQHIFNSHSFIEEYEYSFDETRVYIGDNKSWVHSPIFVHGNGRSDMSKVYNLLK